MPLPKIKFQTNINLELRLKFTEGKLMDSQFGDPQYMYTCCDEDGEANAIFFVSEKVAQKIHGLRLQPREPFDICKAECDYGNGRKGIEWKIARVGNPPEAAAAAIGQQSNGTFVVPKAGVATPAPVAALNRTQPAHDGNGNNKLPAAPAASDDDPRPRVLQPWAQFLLQQTNQLVDVYALALRRAGEQHGGTVRGEDVRSILLSSFINISKNGGGSHGN